MKKVLLIIVALTLLSCAHVASKNTSKQQLTKSYSIGEVKTVKVGEPIVRIYSGPAYPMYEATESYIYDPELPVIKKGDTWIAWLSNDEGYILTKDDVHLIPNYETGLLYCWGLKLSRDCILDKKPWVVVYTFDKDLFKTSEVGFAQYKNKSQKQWEDGKREIFSKCGLDYFVDPELFTSELLYTGREKNTVFLLYREYYGRHARSPFYQDLRYNIDKSSVITFKSLDIEIVNATNENITFKILSDGNTPWMIEGGMRRSND